MKLYVVVAVLACVQVNVVRAGTCQKTISPGVDVAQVLTQLKTELGDASAVAELDSVQQPLAAASISSNDLAKALKDHASKLAKAAATEKDDGRKKLLQQAAERVDNAASRVRARALPGLVVNTTSGEKSVPVAVRLTNQPSNRLRVSLDGVTSGRHLELEWDPAIATSLVQHVDLEGDTWAVSTTVEPIFMQQGDGSVVIATQFSDLEDVGGVITMVGTQGALVASRFNSNSAQQLAMTGWPAPMISFVCNISAKQSMDQIGFSPELNARPAEKRSAVAPEIVTQTLSILAEIAVERAKAGAMKVLQKRFVDPLCSDPDTKVTLSKLKLGKSDELAFPRTCQLLQSIRLEDVLSSGEALLRALRDDARYTLAPEIVKQVAVSRPNLQRLLAAMLDIANRAVDRGSFDGLEAQLLLELVANAGVLLDGLPSMEIPASIKADLQLIVSDKEFLEALCGKDKPAETCVSELVSEQRTPGELYSWAVHVIEKLDDKDLLDDARDRLFGHVAKALDNHADLKEALCGAGNSKQCLLGLYSAAKAAKESWLAYLLEQSSVRRALHVPIANMPEIEKTIGIACRARLAVAIVKKCAGAQCTADQVAAMVERPGDFFKPDATVPAVLCWNGDTYLTAPTEVAALQRIVVDGLELIEPVRTTQGRDRAVAAIELVLKVIERVQGTRDARIVTLGEVAIAIVREQYDSALNGLMRLALQITGESKLPPGLQKLAALSGAVASYAAVYKSTKDDDPKAAREARKKSLESLIDAATHREDRGGNGVVSIGSNVGGSLSYSNVFDQDDARLEREGAMLRPRELALRVPMGLAWQCLPGRKTPDAEARRSSGCDGFTNSWLGLHFGLNLIDLGQFIHADSDQGQRWESFISPGLEAGVLLGGPDHAISVTLHGSFVPGLSDPAAPRQAQWVYGVAVGYYVPFFDLN